MVKSPTEKERAVVGAEAGATARVGMAGSWASAESSGGVRGADGAEARGPPREANPPRKARTLRTRARARRRRGRTITEKERAVEGPEAGEGASVRS